MSHSLVERLHIAAKIHEDIAGQSALAATIREAAAALEAAREDVARYRWMRSLTHENAEVIGRWGAGCGHDPAWLDAAIDAARKEVGDE